MPRPRKLQINEEIEMDGENKTHILARTVTRNNSFGEGGQVPAAVLESELDAWKAKGFKITLASYVETVPEGHVLLFVLEKE